MSQLIGAALPQNILNRKDARHADEAWHGTEDLYQPPPMVLTCWEEEREFAGWRTPWWPHQGGFLGDGGLDVSMLGPAMHKWGEVWGTSGCNGRLAFVGFTRDVAGMPLDACTVRCFVTSSNELVSQVVSDANGYYVATTPYGGVAHFLTVHKASATPVAGATVDTLLPG